MAHACNPRYLEAGAGTSLDHPGLSSKNKLNKPGTMHLLTSTSSVLQFPRQKVPLGPFVGYLAMIKSNVNHIMQQRNQLSCVLNFGRTSP